MVKLPPLLLAVVLLASSAGCGFPWRQAPAPAPAPPPPPPVQVPAVEAPPAVQAPAPPPARPMRAKFKKSDVSEIFYFNWRVGSRGKLYDNAGGGPYPLRVVRIHAADEMLMQVKGGGTPFILHGFQSKDHFDGELLTIDRDMMEVTKTKQLGGSTYLVLESIGDLE